MTKNRLSFLLLSIAALIGVLAARFWSSPAETSLHSLVSLDGKLVPWAKVALVPVDPSQRTLVLTANKDGMCYFPNLQPGDYRILVTGGIGESSQLTDARIAELDDYQRQMLVKAQPEFARSLKSIPDTYANLETTPLAVQLTAGELNHVSLDLHSSQAQLTNADSESAFR